MSEARTYFERAAALWTDDLPDAASVAARCWVGLLETEGRRVPKAGISVETSIKKAANMGRLSVESLCRLAESRIRFSRQQYADVEPLIRPIPLDGDRRVGPELAAQVHYWRGRTLAAQGNPDAAKLEIEKGAEAATRPDGLTAGIFPKGIRFERRCPAHPGKRRRSIWPLNPL